MTGRIRMACTPIVGPWEWAKRLWNLMALSYKQFSERFPPHRKLLGHSHLLLCAVKER
ncbi:MAG: hypothetical protein ABSB32_10040 [Thermodesulfobacteriota bacterium]